MSAGEFYQIFSGFGRSLRDQQERADQRSALSRLGDQIQSNDYAGAASTAMRAGDLQTGIGLLGLVDKQTQRKLTADADAGFLRDFGGGFGGVPGPGAAVLPSFAGGGAAMSLPTGTSKENETKFVGALKEGGLTNPFGLAAAAAYANRESKYSPSNITGSWSDPSESGQAGTSGGILSWRGDRLANMRAFTQGAPDPVTAQAKFFLTEDPNTTIALQNAKSPEEANDILAKAWKFAGYNRTSGGEYVARLNTTRAYLNRLGGAGDQPAAAPTQVASADPSFAQQMPGRGGALTRQVPQGSAPQAPGGSDDVDAYLTASGLPVNAATRGAISLLGPQAGRRFVSNTLANPQAPSISNLDDGVAQAHPELFLNPDGSPKLSGQAFGLIGRQHARGGQRQPVTAAPGALPPGVTSLNPGRPVQVANNEADTQRLEAQMGMMPAQRPANPQADMPVPNAQPAEFQIPPGPQQAMPGAVASLPPGFGAPQARGPALPPQGLPLSSNLGSVGETRVPAGAGPQGLPAFPGDGAPAGQAPAATMPDRAFSAQANAMAQSPLAQRIPMLMRAVANPNLSDGPRQIAQTMLKSALEETTAPPGVREFLYARANGMTQARSPAEYDREKQRDPGADLQSQVRAREAEGIRLGLQPGSPELQNYALGYKPEKDKGADLTAETNAREAAAVRYGMQPGSPEFRSYVLTGKEQTDRDEGAKITSQIEARRKAAPDLGLVEGSPSWRSFVATGKVGADRDMSAADKKLIETADNSVLAASSTISALNEAKELSRKAYGGPWAGKLATLGGLVGSEAATATQNLDNLLTTNALGQLKGIFGGNPTEGERAILLEIQGSSSKPDAVRQLIFDRGIKLAQLRLQQNQDKADALREGRYFRQGGNPAQAQGVSPSGQGGAAALPAPPPSNRPGAASAADRFGQLVGSGMSKSQAYQQLHSEGY